MYMHGKCMCVGVNIYVHECVKGECIGVKGEYMCARVKTYVHERRMHV